LKTKQLKAERLPASLPEQPAVEGVAEQSLKPISVLRGQSAAGLPQVNRQTIERLQQTIGNQAVMRLIAKQRQNQSPAASGLPKTHPVNPGERIQPIQRVGLTVEEAKNVNTARNFWQTLNKPAAASPAPAKSASAGPSKDEEVTDFTKKLPDKPTGKVLTPTI
jgi:hypothetical protein